MESVRACVLVLAARPCLVPDIPTQVQTAEARHCIKQLSCSVLAPRAVDPGNSDDPKSKE